MRVANVDAYRQRHSQQYAVTAADFIDAARCPCCHRALSRAWFRSIFECEPEEYRQSVPSRFVDPSDIQGANVERRSA